MIQIVKPNTNVQFLKHRKEVMAGILLLCLACIILCLIRGFNWGTSFSGGTSIIMHFEDTVSSEELRKVFDDDTRFTNVSVQTYGTPAENKFVIKTQTTSTLSCTKYDDVKSKIPGILNNTLNTQYTFDGWTLCGTKGDDGIRSDFFFSIRDSNNSDTPITTLDPKVVQKAFMDAGLETVVSFDPVLKRFTAKPSGIQTDITELLATSFGPRFDRVNGLESVETVGADVGAKFRTDAIVSIIIALGLMLLYIAFRFDMRYAPAAVAALTVVVIVSLGFISLFKLEFTLETVAALLSLVGYGINDTIVNFDRVRENLASSVEDKPLEVIVTKAINDCLARTFMTSITTLVAIIPMAIYATGATQTFAIILSFGVTISTFNTIFFSCPAVVFIDEWMKKRRIKLDAKKLMEADSEIESEPETKEA